MTDSETPHARAFDLPGWPCPPRVSDIPANENSWGWVPVDAAHEGSTTINAPRVAQDELGRLWVDGDISPVFTLPVDDNHAPGAVVFWTAGGVGLYVHPKSLRYLGNISTLDMRPGQWLPVRAVAAELPEFVKDIA